MANGDKPLLWLHGEVKSPPFSREARRAAGFLLRLAQRGHKLSMPHARAMPVIGPRCHELRINDPIQRVTWRVVLRIDDDAIVIGEKTPKAVIDACKRRFKLYDDASG